MYVGDPVVPAVTCSNKSGSLFLKRRVEFESGEGSPTSLHFSLQVLPVRLQFPDKVRTCWHLRKSPFYYIRILEVPILKQLAI